MDKSKYDLALLKWLISFYEQINKISKRDMVICLSFLIFRMLLVI